jgi:uncharacterized protein (DUF433 family)
MDVRDTTPRVATDESELSEWTSAGVAITRNPRRCDGDPTVAGTRIAVHDVVSYAQHFGGDLERVREEALPDLSLDELQAAMEYYKKHPEEIDGILRQRQAELGRLPLGPTQE